MEKLIIRIILLAFLLCGTSRAANVAFQDFSTNQFSVAGNKVALRAGAFVTNLTFNTFTIPGSGTNSTTYIFPLTNFLSGQLITVITNGPFVYFQGTNLPVSTVVFDTIEELVATPIPLPGIGLLAYVRDPLRGGPLAFYPNSVETTNRFDTYPSTDGPGNWKRPPDPNVYPQHGVVTGGLVTNDTLVAALVLQGSRATGQVKYSGQYEFLHTDDVVFAENGAFYSEDGAQATGLNLSFTGLTNASVYGLYAIAAVADPSVGAIHATNSTVLVQSPRFLGYSGNPVVNSGSSVRIFTYDSAGFVLQAGNGATNLVVSDASGYLGTGTKALFDDGTYKVPSGSGATINPTDTYIPYRLNSTTFSNSPASVQSDGLHIDTNTFVAKTGGYLAVGNVAGNTNSALMLLRTEAESVVIESHTDSGLGFALSQYDTADEGVEINIGNVFTGAPSVFFIRSGTFGPSTRIPFLMGLNANIYLGTSEVGATNNATTGFACIPALAAPPIGVPSGVVANFAPIVIDQIGAKLYFYADSAWQEVTPGAGAGGITGSGTAGNLPVWTAASTQGDSVMKIDSVGAVTGVERLTATNLVASGELAIVGSGGTWNATGFDPEADILMFGFNIDMGTAGTRQITNAASINNVVITPPASTATLTLGSGKTITLNNTMTFNGTDATTMTFPTTSATMAITSGPQTFTGLQTFGAVSVTGFQGAIVTKANADSPYTATGSDYTILCNAVGGAITVTLPAAASHSGRIYNVKKIDSSVNAVTIDADASETIDGVTTQLISTQYHALTIQSDGSNWHIL